MSINLSKMNEEYVKLMGEILGNSAEDIANEIIAETVRTSNKSLAKFKNAKLAAARSEAFDHTGPNLAEDIIKSGQPTYEQALIAYMAEWNDGLVLLNEAYGKTMG